MKESIDDRILEKAKREILENTEEALAIMCCYIASPDKFKDSFEWSCFVGHLFSLVMESQVGLKNPSGLRYDEIEEMTIDEKIKDKLSELNVKEKANIFAFLIGVSNPLTQEKIDSVAMSI